MYVKTTDKIWKSIESRIDQMYKQRTDAAQNWYAYGLSKDEMDKIILESIVQPELSEALKTVRKYVASSNEHVNVRIFTPGGAVDNYDLPIPKDIYIPSEWNSYYGENRPKCTDARVAAVAEKRIAAKNAINEEKKQFVSRMKKLYGSMKSVNALVKAWPPARDLLDADVIKRLDTKVVDDSDDEDIVDPEQAKLAAQKAKLAAEQAAKDMAALKVSLLMAKVAA